MHPLPTPAVVPIVGGLALDEAQRVARAAKRAHARQRFQARNARLQREERQRQAERLARQQRFDIPSAANLDPVRAALERVRTKNADDDIALKQARINVAMSRAQLNKSLKAFGHPPVAEQAARLVALQRELDEAEHALALLNNPASTDPISNSISKTKPSAPEPDKAALNRAKIQLAMRRAALKKAQSAAAPLEQIAALSEEITQAEQTLSTLEAAVTTKLDSTASKE
jgi:electron transport complex protein RnfB